VEKYWSENPESAKKNGKFKAANKVEDEDDEQAVEEYLTNYCPEGNWEELVDVVETVEKKEKGLTVYLKW
jgi:DNA-binding phage protein